jgi:DNA repair exonuclease SbcCD ATPase subunit
LIKIKNLTVKNFMSVGNSTQAIDFDRQDLTLVLGENLDLGGDGSRNGTGKTTIINALSYAMYGTALSNIRKDNLVNKTNGKNMLVSLDFVVGSQAYRIERGRKPNLLKFYINDQEKAAQDDNAQGDSRETQDAIENILGLSHDMFKHIMALNTYTEPFLSLNANSQRTIIEQLLGITMLSERADKIKELNRTTKEDITKEEFRIRAVQEANVRIEGQIDSLKRRQGLWVTKHQEETEKLQTALASLQEINIEAEIQAHKEHALWEQKRKDINDFTTTISRGKLDLDREEKIIKKLEKEIETLEAHTCHTCGQAFHDSKHEQVLTNKTTELVKAKTSRDEYIIGLASLQESLEALGKLGKPPKMFYAKEEDAIQHRANLANLQTQLEVKLAETDPYIEQIADMQTQALQEITYDILNDLTRLQEHQDFLLKLLTNKDSFIRKKIIEQNLSI